MDLSIKANLIVFEENLIPQNEELGGFGKISISTLSYKIQFQPYSPRNLSFITQGIRYMEILTLFSPIINETRTENEIQGDSSRYKQLPP